ncbi:MAG: DUF2304 family protein, partial [Chitinophagaceae bacterium]
CIYIYKKLRNSYIDAVIIFCLAFLCSLLILLPSISNKVAHFFGIGRGVDLIFYFALLFLLFIIAKLYVKIRKLENIIIEIIRNEAIKNVKDLADENKKEV